MKIVQMRTWLFLVVICVQGFRCQDTDSSEDEPVTSGYFNWFTAPGEEAENQTQQGANTRNWFHEFISTDEYTASCGGMSTSAKTVWQNSEYPRTEKLPGLCTLNLLPPARTCALRIKFDDSVLLQRDEDDYYHSSDVNDCPDSRPFFKAYTPGEITATYCSKLDGYEGILAVSDTTEPTVLLLLLDFSVQVRFKISITAVNCNDIKTYQSPSDCGIKNQDLATLRTELLGDLHSEQTQDPADIGNEDHLPLTYRQRRRTSDDSSSQSEDRKNKNKNKNKNISNINKKPETDTNRKKVHPLVKEFRKVIAAAEAAGKISKVNSKTRVKGKKTTHVNEWPWIVLIEKNDMDDYGYLEVDTCNGVLLDNSKVLTSRECFFEHQKPVGIEDISVRIGDHDLDSTTETKSKIVRVSKVTVPLKNTIFYQKDAFAILHLKEEVKLSDTIRPVCLPVAYNSFDDSGIVAGWEIELRYDGYQPVDPLPNEAKVTVMDQTSCKKVIDDYWYFDEINIANVVCAANAESRYGPICGYDLGNSLTQRDRRGAYYVTGVAMAGIQRCFYSDVPSVFSKIEPDNQFLNVALA